MPERPSHKLVVILHAHVVGSTVLVQHDETVAHQRIQDSFRRFSETIEAYGGVTHELRGDALVAEFDRASEVVEASSKGITLKKPAGGTVARVYEAASEHCRKHGKKSSLMNSPPPKYVFGCR